MRDRVNQRRGSTDCHEMKALGNELRGERGPEIRERFADLLGSERCNTSFGAGLWRLVGVSVPSYSSRNSHSSAWQSPKAIE